MSIRSKPRIVVLFLIAAILAGLGLPAANDATTISVRSASGQEGGESSVLAPGVTLEMLSSEVIQPWTDMVRSGLALTFDRVPLPPGTRLTDLSEHPAIERLFQSHTLVAGPRLFYVDEGAVIIEQSGQTVPLASGDDLLVPAGIPFDARNAAEQCSTLFVLTLNHLGQAGGYSSKVTGPRFSPAEPCPPPARLLEWSTGASLSSGFDKLFIARMTFDPAGYQYDFGEGVGRIHHPGPVALMVEQGALAVSEDQGQGGDLNAPGSTVTLDDHTPYIAEYYPLGNDPGEKGTVILAGVIPPDSSLVVQGNAFRSPAGGFAISYGPWWSEVRQTIEHSPPYSRLEMTNYSSWVTFEDAPYYEGGVSQCLLDAVAEVVNDDSIQLTNQSDQPVVRVSGNSLERAIATVTYQGMYFDGTPGEFIRHIECMQLRSETSVLRIDAVLPVAELGTQVPEVEEMLSGLVLLG